MSKLTDKTLEEASANGDGTYNGATALRWIFEALTGKPLSDEEVRQMWERAKEERRVRSPGDA